MSTVDQQQRFADELDRLGARSVAGALGFMGDHDDVELDENLLYAFEDLPATDAEQALRKLAITR